MKIFDAGPITTTYENGFLRRISYGETEVLRMIYFALRDHNWNTLAGDINNEVIRIDDSGFRISYDYTNILGGEDVMEWKAEIEGRSDGTITFEIQGTALENFRKNRAGFCVLHPLRVAGAEVLITHPDMTRSTQTFPVNVAPDDPFTNILSIEWKSTDIPFSLTFEGDVFETEDQRNWSDASFKTFCTPLDKPFPVELRRGEKVFQRITFKPLVRLTAPSPSMPYISLRETGTRSVMPFFGISASTEISDINGSAAAMIRSLNLHHYRVDVRPGDDHWVADFSRECVTAFQLNLPLEVVLHLTDNYRMEMEAFVALCLQNRVKVRKVLLLQVGHLVTPDALIVEASQIRAAFPDVQVGGGTNYNFTEINRHRFSARDLDYISFSIDPQEHAFDDLTIMENIESQEHLVRSAKAIYGEEKPIHVSPITLRKRFNPYATNAADRVIAESLKADPRQKEVFAALWTFGSLCSLCRGGASAVTFYQTIGNQGILSTNGDPYPVYDALKALSPYQGRNVWNIESSDPLSVQAIMLDDKFLGLANLTHNEQTVRFGDHKFSVGPRRIQMQALHRAQ